ncbi:hypothetical protein [Natronococcus sp.]|uniref:hypothetical protein n=1 Tax=Natronococcus sp. TaxID=35747 RepID=UPI003A4DC458
MTAENPEAVLEDDSDDDQELWAGVLTLAVAFLLTVFVVATDAPLEIVVLTVGIWLSGGAVRFAEVRAR